jgi:hypothetical protein
MDNIAKLVLGVVGVIGLIVLMIPQGNPLTDKGPETAVAVGAPDPIPNEAPKNEPDAVTPINAPTQDISAFGQPMLDPTPPGQRQVQNQPTSPPPSGNEGNYSSQEPVAPYPANPGFGTPAYGGVPSYEPVEIPNIPQ